MIFTDLAVKTSCSGFHLSALFSCKDALSFTNINTNKNTKADTNTNEKRNTNTNNTNTNTHLSVRFSYKRRRSLQFPPRVSTFSAPVK